MNYILLIIILFIGLVVFGFVLFFVFSLCNTASDADEQHLRAFLNHYQDEENITSGCPVIKE